VYKKIEKGEWKRMKKEKLAGIYINVSDSLQQLESLEALCKSKGYEIYDIYEDAGINGKDTKKPELQRLLADIVAKKVNMIVALKSDRIIRNVYDLESIMTFLEEHDACIDFANDDVNITNNKLVSKILMSITHYEFEKSHEKRRLG